MQAKREVFKYTITKRIAAGQFAIEARNIVMDFANFSGRTADGWPIITLKRAQAAPSVNSSSLECFSVSLSFGT
jgi:hypothetical protein